MVCSFLIAHTSFTHSFSTSLLRVFRGLGTEPHHPWLARSDLSPFCVSPSSSFQQFPWWATPVKPGGSKLSGSTKDPR